MSEPYLAAHPWDAIGKPPEPGKPYVEPEPEPQSAASADPDGFTDSKGRRMDFEEGVSQAADCIVRQGDTFAVEDMIRFNLSPDEILVWLVDPDTGEFADPPA